MRISILILLFPFLFISCRKDESADPKPPAPTSMENIAYGSDPKQQFDLFLPPSPSVDSTRTMILIHSGGWTGGDKSEYNDYIREFQKRYPSYAFVTMNYRLVTKTTNFFPTQEEDVLACMQFLKARALEYKVSGTFVLLGISAGGHLALLQAYKHNDEVPVIGVVSFFGPTDLKELYQQSDSSLLAGLKGNTSVGEDQLEKTFTASSSLNFVTHNSPPTLLFHGDRDSIVPVRQAELLHAKLDSLGVSNDLVIYAGEGHGWFGNNLVDSFNRLDAFLESL